MTREHKLATFLAALFLPPQAGCLAAGITMGFSSVVFEMAGLYFVMGLLVSLGVLAGAAFKDDQSTGDKSE
jgi:ABC-type branched-subunit amino acid transport system permease subunit